VPTIVATEPRRPAAGRLAAIALATLAGCAEELGPEPMPTARAAGVVTADGRPVVGGWIELLPVDGTVGRLRSGRLGPDGSFQVDRAPVGRVAIRLAGPVRMADGGPLPRRLDRFRSAYLIRRAVPPGGTDALAIDLGDEPIGR